MEKYKKMLQQRMTSCTVLLTSGSLIFIILRQQFMEKYLPTTDFGDFLSGFQVGVFIAFEIAMLFTLVRTGTLLKDEKQLKESYIKATDERTIRISELSGEKLYYPLIMPILFAAIVAGYFSAAVFFTLLAVIVFIFSIIYSRWLYFNKIM